MDGHKLKTINSVLAKQMGAGFNFLRKSFNPNRVMNRRNLYVNSGDI
jgi:hypothetical protein